MVAQGQKPGGSEILPLRPESGPWHLWLVNRRPTQVAFALHIALRRGRHGPLTVVAYDEGGDFLRPDGGPALRAGPSTRARNDRTWNCSASAPN